MPLSIGLSAMVNAQRVVAVQVDADFQTNALHILIARRLRRAH